MADKLVLSEATLPYSHVKSILRKLDAHSRAEAIAAVEAMSASAHRRRCDRRSSSPHGGANLPTSVKIFPLSHPPADVETRITVGR